MKKSILLFALLSPFIFLAAQNRTITGKVTDDKGIPIASASVNVKGTSIGTTTSPEGFFSISVPSGRSTLIISHINMATKEVQVTDQTSVTVLLQANNQTLQEVVVTALGISKDRRTLGYATQSVKNEALIDKGEGSLLNTLQGKIAGADITSASGAAGASTSIILRGISSFTGNQSPLLVVDGIPISDNVDETTVGLYSNQPSNRAMDLNVNNIESVNVLAGPAAAALYGSRAAHGAIMITTKKGSGQRGVVNITLNSSYTVEKVYGLPELQNKYGQGLNGVFSAISANSFGPAFGSTPTLANGLIVGATPQYVNGITYTSGQTIPYQAYPDNFLTYFKTGGVFENNLSVSSGDAKNYYSITLGNSKQDGILPNTEFKKTNVGFNASTYFTDKLSAKAGATYFSTVQNAITQGSNATYSAYANAYRIPRSVDFEYYKNHYTTPGGYNNWYVANIYNTAIQDSSSASDNPYFSAYKNPLKGSVSRILGNLTVGYDITNWLNVSYRAGVDAYTDRRKRIIALGSAQVVRSAYTGAPGTTTGGVMEDIIYRSELNGDLMITAKRNDVFVHGLNANILLGQGVLQQKFQQVNQTGYSLAVPEFYNITNASNLTLSNEFNSTRRLWGLYGQLSLAYNNYLFLELTGRQDRSSTLPKNKNAYFYPSVSASLVLTDAFDIKSDLLSFAKIRAAYAKVGNDAPVYSLNNTFLSAAVGNNVANFAFPFGSTAGFSASTTLGNKELTPEFINTIDIGLNIGLFKNKLNIDATVYNSKSTDQIVPVGLPASSGYLNRFINVGEMTNKGVEITVTANPIKTKNFSWNVSGNFSLNKNKVISLFPGVNSFSYGGVSFSGLIPTIAVGEAYGIIRGGKFVRNELGQLLIDSTTGLFANYVTDVTVLDPNRDWISGLTNNFTYKNLSLSFLVDYKQGGQFESFTITTLRANGSLKVTEDRDQPFILPGVIDLGNGKYRPNNIQISGQSYYNAATGAATGSTTANEFAVFDASTFRIREVSLSYDLNGSSVHTKMFKNIRFTVYGRNLYFYAPNSPIDPELSTQGAGTGFLLGGGGNLVRGLELGSAPNTRNIGASVRITL
ncbi:MAG TPA: SusC/RagA family TonB-linked outer membrane protein [Chitinophagaceae bacterium]|nr:SusC/RagA family TonB-linked outer membrane protein [Chitinophagaceae bacterium]